MSLRLVRAFFVPLLVSFALLTSARWVKAEGGKDDGPLVKPLAELTQELADGKQADYLFPLQALPNIDAASLKLAPETPLDVAQGSQHLYALRAAFKPTLQQSGSRLLLKINVDFEQIAQAATYEITLGITGQTSEPKAPAPAPSLPSSSSPPSPPPPAAVTKQQTLIVKLVHPEGQLRVASGTLVIDINDLWFRPPQILPPELHVSELSKRSRVEVKSFAVVDDPSQDDRRLNAGLKPTLPAKIEAGSSASVPFTVWGNLPAGTTKASIQLDAEQLKVPLLVPYEIHHRLYWGWVPLLFFLSSVLGWFVRSYLQHWKEYSALRAQADELLRRIYLQKEASPESTTRAELESAGKQIEGSYDDANPQALTTAIQAADTTLKNVLTQRAKQQQALLASLEQWRSFLKRRAALPQELGPWCEKVDQALKNAEEEAIADNLIGASAQRDTADKELKGLRAASIKWAEAVRGEVKKLNGLPWVQKASLSPELLKKVSAAIDKVAEFDENQLGTVDLTLQPVQDTVAVAQLLARQLREQLKGAAEECVQKIGLEQMRGLEARAKELRQVGAIEITAELLVVFERLMREAERLVRMIGEAIEAAYPAVTATQRSQIADLLRKAEYASAIEVVTHFDRSMSGDSPAVEKPESQPAVTLPPPAGSGETREAPPANSTVTVVNRYLPLEVRRARSAAELWQATFVRTLGYAIVSTVAATLVFAPKFVGTWGDISGLCAFGFGADFTVSTVLDQLLGRLRPS